MSIQFNDTDTKKGLVQFYEEEIGVDTGYISGNSDRLKKFTARVNLALDSYFAIAVQASGTWELDDNNHTDYAVIYATLTSGQKDYSFLTDGTGNAILDIYKVLVLPTATSTIYQEVTPVNENESRNIDMINEGGVVGSPSKYAKRSNAIHFEATPNYTVAKGVKVLINRESSYFTTSDTTKKPGYPYHQEYFYLKPSLEFARRNSLASLTRLEKAIFDLEGDLTSGRVGSIAKAYGNREKDIIKSISGEIINSI